MMKIGDLPNRSIFEEVTYYYRILTVTYELLTNLLNVCYNQYELNMKFKYTWISVYPFPSISINSIHQFAAMWYSNYICVCRLSWTKQSRDTLIFDHLFWYTHDIKWNCLEHIPFYVFTLKIWMKRKVELIYLLHINWKLSRRLHRSNTKFNWY